MRTTITVEDDVADAARDLGINLSAAAREGIAEAVRRARAEHDRVVYENRPESGDDWEDAEAWGP